MSCGNICSVKEFEMTFVEFDPTLQAGIIAAVIALVGVLIRFVASYVPWLGLFLEKYKEEWGTGLGVLLVNILQAKLPGGEWASVSVIGVELLVAVVVVLLAKLGAVRAGAKLR